MYVHSLLSDYFRRHNKEFKDGKSLGLISDLKILEEFNMKDLLNVKKFDSNIKYKTNFRKFCNNERRDIQQKFTTKKFFNYIDIENKNYSLFEYQLQ